VRTIKRPGSGPCLGSAKKVRDTTDQIALTPVSLASWYQDGIELRPDGRAARTVRSPIPKRSAGDPDKQSG
jgi:hypothetical protein